MTLESALFLLIICTIVMFVFFVLTDETTPEERDAMLDDKDMWP